MKKQLLFAFVFLAFVACSKPNRKDPMAPASPATDSAQEADSKKAAQKDAQKDGSGSNASGDPQANGNEKKDPNAPPEAPAPAAPDSSGGPTSPVTPNSTELGDGNTNSNANNGNPGSGSTPTPEPSIPEKGKEVSNQGEKPNPDVATKPNESTKPNEGSKPNDVAKPDVGVKPDDTAKADDASKPDSSAQPNETAKPDSQADGPKGQQSEKPVETAENKPAPSTTLGFPFKESYMGDALTLVHPRQNQKNWGEVRISGADAQKLFQTLKLRQLHVDGNDVWLEGKKKHGYHISCYEQANKEKPNQPEYDCALFLEFTTGTLVPKVSKIQKDDSVPELKEAYNGQMVKLIAPDAKKWGWIQLKGQDAKALYATLAVEENSQPHSNSDYQPLKQKIGRNVVCYEHTLIKNPGSPSYACSFHILYTNGLARPFAETVEPKKTWVQSLKEKMGFK